jgi:anti-sigma regulatory factor (Ser/Thr protein kinase)
VRPGPRRFAGEIADLHRVSEWMQDAARQAGLNDDAAYRADLCVHEAVANVIRHAYAPGNAGAFEVSMIAGDGGEGLEVTLADEGRSFDPLQHPAPPEPAGIENLPVGGLGIHLMRSFADGLEYRRAGARNLLVMRFRNRRT